MLIIVNATFLINAMRTEPEILRQMKLSTIKSAADELENELGIGIHDFNIEILQKESSIIEISNEKRQQLSGTDMNLLYACHKRRKQCIMVSDDLVLKNAALENNITCYTTPEFMAYLLRKGVISKPQCVKFLNILRKIYIRSRDIDKVLKRIEGW